MVVHLAVVAPLVSIFFSSALKLSVAIFSTTVALQV
jgi:hypothetical protein